MLRTRWGHFPSTGTSKCPFLRSVLASLLTVCLLANGSGGEEKAGQLTIAQVKQIDTMTATFRRAKSNPAQRLSLIGQAAEISPPHAYALIDIVEREMRPALLQYQTRFLRAAEKSVAAKFNAANVQEIIQLREQVHTLTKKQDLTQDEIKGIADPAVAKLKELVLIDRNDILQQSAELRKQRQYLAPSGAFWEKCQHAAYEVLRRETPENAPPPAPVAFDSLLARQEELATLMALPMDNATRGVLAQNDKLAESLDREEAECILELNLLRHLLGLPLLTIDPALCKAAKEHSSDMMEHQFFSHNSPLKGKETPWNRAKLAGTTCSGENIAAGMTEGSAANRAWWYSPGHMRNMLGSHRRVGVGRVGKHWTEMFGG